MTPALNASQEAVVFHAGSNLIVSAGPGTGKTRTLTYRIKHLAEQLLPSEKILAITFTNKAAGEMSSRLAALGVNKDSVVLGTFHSFALSILRKHREKLPFPLDFTIITPEEAEEFAVEVWPNASRRERKALLEQVSTEKCSGATAAGSEPLCLYQAFLKGQGLVDFDDILRDGVLLLKDNTAVRNELQELYRFVLVDEYQDINTVQNELLKLLVGGQIKLTVIGDPDQSIYSFQGSDPSLFPDFANHFPPAEGLSLTDNYRSCANLLKASGQVINGGIRQAGAAGIVAGIKETGELVINVSETEKAEADFVAREIEKLVGGLSMLARKPDSAQCFSFEDVAVLYRLNIQARAF